MLSAAFHGGLGTGVDFDLAFRKVEEQRAPEAGADADADAPAPAPRKIEADYFGGLPIEVRAGYRLFLKNAGWFIDPVLVFRTDFAHFSKGAKFAAHAPFKSGAVTGVEFRIGKVLARNWSVYAIFPSPTLDYTIAKKEAERSFAFKLSTGAGAEYKLHRNISLAGAVKVGVGYGNDENHRRTVTVNTSAVVGVEVHQSNYYGD